MGMPSLGHIWSNFSPATLCALLPASFILSQSVAPACFNAMHVEWYALLTYLFHTFPLVSFVEFGSGSQFGITTGKVEQSTSVIMLQEGFFRTPAFGFAFALLPASAGCLLFLGACSSLCPLLSLVLGFLNHLLVRLIER